jgi:formate-dependent nitrite reductase cytochrome c552 subunit
MRLDIAQFDRYCSKRSKDTLRWMIESRKRHIKDIEKEINICKKYKKNR